MRPRLEFFFIFFISLVFLLIPPVHAMGLRGTNLVDTVYYSPGLERDYSYMFSTNSGFTQDYELFVRMEGTDVDLTPYVTLDKYYVKDVGTGSLIPFNAHLKLPDTPPAAGIHEIRVGATETQSLGGGGMMGFRTAAEARIFVTVLCPSYCAISSIYVPNTNENQTLDITFTVQNIGEPDLPIKGRVDIYQDNLLVGVARTEDALIPKTEKKAIHAFFNTTGLKPGPYTALGTLAWGKNLTEFNESFIIGTKTLPVTDYTKELVKDAINKMQITVKSGWNNKMYNVYADIIILDNNEQMVTARTISNTVLPWEYATLTGYVDTTGLDYKTYPVKIIMTYEGQVATTEGFVTIKEGALVETVKEIPKEETKASSMNGYIIALLSFVAVLIMVFIIVLLLILKNKKNSSP
jgi:hypothetical protein